MALAVAVVAADAEDAAPSEAIAAPKAALRIIEFMSYPFQAKNPRAPPAPVQTGSSPAMAVK